MGKAPCTDFLVQVRSPGRVASYPWREQCRQARRRSRRGLPPREPPPGMPPYLLPSEDALPDPRVASLSWPCSSPTTLAPASWLCGCPRLATTCRLPRGEGLPSERRRIRASIRARVAKSRSEANHLAYCSVWRTSITLGAYHIGYDRRHRRRPRRARRGLGRPYPASPGDHPAPGGLRRPGRGDRGRPGPRPLGDREREPRGVGPLAIPPDPLSEEDRPIRPPHRHDRHLPRQPQRRPLPQPRRLDLPRQPRRLAQEPTPGGREEGGHRRHRPPLGDRRRRGVGPKSAKCRAPYGLYGPAG